jgi:methyl-accepting chemotaxis protein
MKLKTKLTLGAVLLGFIPALISTILIGTIATSTGQELIKEQAKNQLIAVRETTSENIEGYFNTIRNQVLTFSHDRMIIDAMGTFKKAFNEAEQSAPLSNNDSQALENYYQSQFGVVYQESNPSSAVIPLELLDGLSNKTKAFQSKFISNNTFPLGEKDRLIRPKGASDYADAHEYYHPSIQDFLKRFEFYDIFLVDSDTGNIVYSVFKELDFATSLLTGPYKNSGIAEAFKAVQNAQDVDDVFLTDFKAYTPSYEAAASFIASPIFQDNKQIGVLIFQMPIGRINELMTHFEKWSESGLGESGETYLVGEDLVMRSMSRFLIEAPDEYFDLLRKIGTPESLIIDIKTKNSSVSLQPVNTLGTQAASNGERGFQIFKDYRGVSVLSAYKPLEIEGLNWAIMSEIDESEAFAFTSILSERIVTIAIIIMTVTIITGAGIGILFGRQIFQPIRKTIDRLQNIAEGDGDLTLLLDENRNDEMGELAHWFNKFMTDVRSLIHEMKRMSDDLVTASDEFSMDAEKTSDSIGQQNVLTKDISTSIQQMQVLMESVSNSSAKTTELSNGTFDSTQKGVEVIKACTTSIDSLSKDIVKMAEVIGKLDSASEEVGQVISVIRAIAEQTNLLALNAAIEAARAGESGRGFAVVADEVRMLASRTQESTATIEASIENIQGGVTQAVKLADYSKQSVEVGLDNATQADQAFNSISEAVSTINSTSEHLSSAAKHQYETAQAISTQVVDINQFAANTDTLAKSISDRGHSLKTYVNDLTQKLMRYRT